MASLSGADFYAYILRKFMRTDKSTEIYEAITDVIMEIKLRYQFEDFKTVLSTSTIPVAGDYTFDIPSSFGHLIGDIILLGDTDRPLVKVSKTKYDALYPDVTEADVTDGVPKHYCLFGGKFYIGPVPDKTTYEYQLNYTTEEMTQIVAGTSAVPFTDKYRWVLRNLVLAEIYAGIGNDAESQKWEAKGLGGIELMVANERSNVDTSVNVEFNDIG